MPFSVKILLVVMFLFLFGGVASSSDLFTVDGIKVSSSGVTAKQAKDTAVLNGQREAFGKLLDRIASNLPKNELTNNMTPDKLSELVQGMEVNEEKVAAAYYSATLNISFNKALVENILKDNKVSYADKKSAPIILVPFLMSNNQNMLFEEENPLRNALANIAKENRKLTIIVPVNLRGVDKAKLNLNIEGLSQEVRDSLLKVGQNYKADKVVLIVANKSESNNFNIRLQDVRDKTSAIKEISFGVKDIGSEDVFNYAARNIVSALENQWNTLGNESDANLAKITVTVPISSLEEWSSIQKKLQLFNFLKVVTVRSMTVQNVLVDLTFRDSFEDLNNKMLENGFWLEKSQDKITLLANKNTDPMIIQKGSGSLEGSTDDIQK